MHRSKRSKNQLDSFEDVDELDSSDLHHKLPQGHSPHTSQQDSPIHSRRAHVTSLEQQLPWQSHSPALPTTASSADVGLPLSSDAHSVSFAALQIDPKRTFVSSTPLKSRLSSYDAHHQSHVRPAVNCRQVGKLLKKEIQSDMEVEDGALCQKIFYFPDDIKFTRELLTRMKRVWDTKQNNWKFDCDHSEESIANLLNLIGKEFCRVKKIAQVRKWVAETCNTPPKGANPATPLKCKPDIVLIDKEFRNPTWDRIHAFGEITSQTYYHATMKETVFTKTHVIFSAQQSRRFVCSFAFYGEDARLSLIDREGILYQKVRFLNPGWQNAATFVHMIVGFMCGSLTGLGYDPTIQLKDGAVNTIDVTQSGNTTTYRVTKKLHVTTGVFGRGTHVWHAHLLDNEMKQVVIKDAWPLVSRAELEGEALRCLDGVPGIPVIAQMATVSFPRYEGGRRNQDSTNIFRSAVVSRSVRNRVHRRFVMSSVGTRMGHFRNLSELIGAFRDIIIGK